MVMNLTPESGPNSCREPPVDRIQCFHLADQFAVYARQSASLSPRTLAVETSVSACNAGALARIVTSAGLYRNRDYLALHLFLLFTWVR
jgi:hypothetical protein